MIQWNANVWSTSTKLSANYSSACEYSMKISPSKTFSLKSSCSNLKFKRTPRSAWRALISKSWRLWIWTQMNTNQTIVAYLLTIETPYLKIAIINRQKIMQWSKKISKVSFLLVKLIWQNKMESSLIFIFQLIVMLANCHRLNLIRPEKFETQSQ